MIIGKKIGMTRIFDKDNNVIPVSLVEAGPCSIIKKEKKFIILGFEILKKITKSKKIYFKKINCNPVKYIKKFILKNNIQELEQKKEINVCDFKIGNHIDLTAISKGKGFAGGMKRHGFSGMPASHGHEKQRIPGSIGCRFPQRTIKGKRMAGHMGNEKITVKNLKIVDIDEKNNILALKGAVPGIKGTIVYIKSK